MALRRKNKIIIIIGILISFIGFFLIGDDVYKKYKINNEEQRAIKTFYIEEEKVEERKELKEKETPKVKEKKEKINYIAILKIPKINLVRGLVDRNSYLNNVKYNIQILKESTSPEVTNGNVILVSHSGNSRVSYFRRLHELDLKDKVILEYNNKIYEYEVVNKYEIEKNGKAKITRNKDKNTLTLITCKHNTNMQIVVICELIVK